jgi:hypothetical protein
VAFRFRRSLKLAPGVRLNIGKKSASVRLGPRGVGYTLGTRGQRLSAGMPGTGVYLSKKLPTGEGQAAVDPIVPPAHSGRFSGARGVVVIGGLILLLAILFLR